MIYCSDLLRCFPFSAIELFFLPPPSFSPFSHPLIFSGCRLVHDGPASVKWIYKVVKNQTCTASFLTTRRPETPRQNGHTLSGGCDILRVLRALLIRSVMLRSAGFMFPLLLWALFDNTAPHNRCLGFEMFLFVLTRWLVEFYRDPYIKGVLVSFVLILKAVASQVWPEWSGVLLECFHVT